MFDPVSVRPRRHRELLPPAYAQPSVAWSHRTRRATPLRLALVLALLSTSVGQTASALPWEKMGGPLGGLGYNVRIHPTNKNIMFVTDAWSGVNRSTDGGATWRTENTGIDTRGGPSNDAIPVFSLAIDKLNPNIVWVGTQGVRGVFKSVDGGLTYSRMENGILENDGLTIRNFEIHPTDSNTVFATGELSTGLQGTECDGRRLPLGHLLLDRCGGLVANGQRRPHHAGHQHAGLLR